MAPQPAPFEPNVPPDELEGDKAQVESKDDAALLQTMGYKPVCCSLYIPSYKPLSSAQPRRRIGPPQNLYSAGEFLNDIRYVPCPSGSESDNNIVTAALYFIGGVRVTYSTGIAAGGNLAYW